jgi:hypothetical protein
MPVSTGARLLKLQERLIKCNGLFQLTLTVFGGASALLPKTFQSVHL